MIVIILCYYHHQKHHNLNGPLEILLRHNYRPGSHTDCWFLRHENDKAQRVPTALRNISIGNKLMTFKLFKSHSSRQTSILLKSYHFRHCRICWEEKLFLSKPVDWWKLVEILTSRYPLSHSFTLLYTSKYSKMITFAEVGRGKRCVFYLSTLVILKSCLVKVKVWIICSKATGMIISFHRQKKFVLSHI